MNLKHCINRMMKFPDIFKLHKQQNEDVCSYFRQGFECVNVPEDFYMFISTFNGLKIDNFHVFSINNEDKPFAAQTYEEFYRDNGIEDYQAKLAIESKNKLFFFATDNKSGIYAFKKENNDQKIFYISTYSPKIIIVYENFADLLNEKIENTIKNSIM